jgi:hypothetical protein
VIGRADRRAAARGLLSSAGGLRPVLERRSLSGERKRVLPKRRYVRGNIPHSVVGKVHFVQRPMRRVVVPVN